MRADLITDSFPPAAISSRGRDAMKRARTTRCAFIAAPSTATTGRRCAAWPCLTAKRTTRHGPQVPAEMRDEESMDPSRTASSPSRLSCCFCVPGSDEWMEGMTENISRSGLLFRSSSPLEVGSSLELNLEMPHELTGDRRRPGGVRRLTAARRSGFADSQESAAHRSCWPVRSRSTSLRPAGRAGESERRSSLSG